MHTNALHVEVFMRKFPPCKDCQKRYVGCHKDCTDYKKFSEEKRQENAARYNYMSERFGHAAKLAKTTHNSVRSIAKASNESKYRRKH